MLIVGKKLIPAILHYVAHTGSRELFRLAVLSIALGVAYAAAELFGISLALGAFFAGMMLSESQLSQQAATESLPLRDAFAVLFFVSVGMLFNPAIVVGGACWRCSRPCSSFWSPSRSRPYVVVRLSGTRARPALMISASLAQIGEFSFILADRSLQLGLLPEEGRDLILAGAIITILLNPLLFAALDIYAARREKAARRGGAGRRQEEEPPMREPIRPTSLKDHVVLIGHGRVGSFISSVLNERNVPLFVIEDDEDGVAALKAAWHRGACRQCRRSRGDPCGESCPRRAASWSPFPTPSKAARWCSRPAPSIRSCRSSRGPIPRKRSTTSSGTARALVVMGEHEIAKAMLDNVAEVATLVEQAAAASAGARRLLWPKNLRRPARALTERLVPQR